MCIRIVFHNHDEIFFLMLCMLAKNSADDILKYFFFLIFFFQKKGFDFHAKKTISMKRTRPIFRKKNINKAE